MNLPVPSPRPLAPAPTPTSGYMLITVLLVLTLLASLGSVLLYKSTSELKQSASSTALASARSLAEAGQADGQYQLANAGLRIINTNLRQYTSAFSLSQKDAGKTPIILPEQYSTVLNDLNASFVRTTGSLNGGTYGYQVNFQSLRSDPGSFSAAGQTYYLDYSIGSDAAQDVNTRTVTTRGTLLIQLGRISLNQYVFLADDGGSGPDGKSGFFDTSSVYDGPVHVNKNWALSGSPTFLSGATTADSSVWMNDARNKSGQCSGFAFVKVTGQQASPAACTQPNTNGRGLRFGADKVDLPGNAFSQRNAALGLPATDSQGQAATTPASDAQACAALGDSACPGNSSNLKPGTYLRSNGQTPPRLIGGIFVQGDAAVTLSTSGAKQVYTIADSKKGVTVITVDYAAQTTTFSVDKDSPVTYQGVPNGQLYVSGQITSLQGPARTGVLPAPAPTGSVPAVVPPALAAQSQLNIAARGAITVNGDLTYTDDPRSTPGARNVLGLISGEDNIVVGDNAPDDVYIQGAMLAGSSGDGLSVKSPSRTPARGAIHLLGSLAESTDQIRGIVDASGKAQAGYADDFKFDQRFTNGGVAPPFFPATTQFAVQAGYPIQRSWQEQ